MAPEAIALRTTAGSKVSVRRPPRYRLRLFWKTLCVCANVIGGAMVIGPMETELISVRLLPINQSPIFELLREPKKALNFF
jgi:hypothetical protein